MDTILTKLVKQQPVTDNDIEEALYDICEREHASCNPSCPVYAKLGCTPKTTDHGKEHGCDAFKLGSVMLKILRSKSHAG